MSDRDQNRGEPLAIEDFYEAGHSTDDRRCEPRFPCDKLIAIRSCRPGDDRGFRPVRLLDCSVHGLGVFADDPMLAGEEFLVEFKLERLMLAVYTVRHCRPVANGHIVGAALTGFIGGSDEPDAEALVKALVAASHKSKAG